MSKFFSDIQKEFEKQTENDFKRENFYKDKNFNFDTKEKKENCILTDMTIKNPIEKKEINKAIHLIYKFYNPLIKDKWSKNYKFIGKKFNMKKLEDYYKKYTKPENLTISKDEIEKEFKNGKETIRDGKKKVNFDFQKYCFVNEYISNNDEKTQNENILKIYNELFEYKSLRKIKQKYKLFKNELNCTFAKQGILGDCYFIEALSILSNYGQLIYQLFPKEDIPSNGIFTVCLFVNGEWQKVYIDDYFFFYKGTDEFAFTQPVDNCIYTCVLEKAFAKVMGSFSAINGGNNESAFRILTGFESINYFTEIINPSFLSFFHDKLKKGYLFSCGNSEHAYSLLNIYSEKEDIFLQLRNPWGDRTNNEKEIDELARKCITNYGLDNKDNNEENNIPKKKSKTVKKKGKEKEDEEKAKNNGIFVIPLKEFKEKFKIITICQILFNSKIFSFPINLQDISGSFIYFKIELLQDTEFGITLYQDPEDN